MGDFRPTTPGEEIAFDEGEAGSPVLVELACAGRGCSAVAMPLDRTIIRQIANTVVARGAFTYFPEDMRLSL